MVHDPVDGPLESLVSTFKHVLMLVICLATPQTDPEEVKVIHEFGPSVVAGMVTEKAIRCSPFAHE